MPSTISQSQATNFEQRLIALERKVGTERLQNTGAAAAVAVGVVSSSLDDRLNKLKSELQSKLSSSTKTNNQDSHRTIQKLLKELDPGIALTHQQQPLLYKRQMVLASCDELKQNLQQLDSIGNLLLSGTKANNNGLGDSSLESKATATTSSSTAKSKSTNKNDEKDDKKKDETILQQRQRQQQQQQKETSRSSNDTSSSSSSLRLDQVTQAPILTQHYDEWKTEHQQQKRLEDLTLKFKLLHERQSKLQQQLRHYLECYHTTAMAVSEKIVLADETIHAIK